MHDAIKTIIRPHYLTLKGYVSAGMESDKTAEKIFLNANENPHALPGLEGLNRYPEPQPAALRKAYAALYGVGAHKIAMTRGADEAIFILTKLFCEPHKDAILINPPTFGIYAVDARSMPAGVLEVPLIKEGGTFKLDVEGIIAALERDARIKLIYICTPNNPSGTPFEQEKILEIARAAQGRAIVIVDETYAEFSTQGSLCARLENAPNMIILRTLSKSFALAGERMGCFISADEDFITLACGAALDAYPLPRSTVEAALHALSPEILPIARENIKIILAERERMQAALEESALVRHIYPSDANFLLIEMDNADAFCDFTAQNNVILRNFAALQYTENCIRLSIGTREDNDIVLKLLEKFEKSFT